MKTVSQSFIHLTSASLFHLMLQMNPLALAVAGLVISMILYFLVSIVNQLAQRHQHRRDKVT